MQGWCIVSTHRASSLFKRLIIVRVGCGAGLAKDLATCAADVAVVVDTLAADRAGDTLRFVARHLTRMNRHTYPLLAEELGVRKLAIGKHLLLVLVFDIRVEFAGSLLGRFKRGDADTFVCWRVASRIQRRTQVYEGGGHLSPVPKLEGAFAKTAAGDDGDGVGGAAVDLHKGDESLAIGTARLVDAKSLAANHGEANAEDLSGAEMAVGEFGLAEEIVKGLHETMIVP